MENTELAERLRAVFTDVMGTPPVNGLKTMPEDTENWDSLAQVRLFTAVERDFGLVLPKQLMLIGPDLGAFATAMDSAQ
ncbi:acyl carrier protein [Amycolatopsis keratiniphila]|uniref:Carrier domain-containing protein n=1 Tax=Amycolatopsis keratiniphila subsp. keratiniphila TaxID=227715 RepID=A0A1W2M4N1_9PSEU|nr:hypothetical protein [Amycolatopsis keratiniphila]ONF75002.1 hypothetical protein AVR91_0200320 [Amycolatopsis keratiniphila subsp. keratiniphila]